MAPFDQEFYVASPRSEPRVTDNILRVLIEARAIIEDPARWCVGDRCNPDGQHCALGALEVATGSKTYDLPSNCAAAGWLARFSSSSAYHAFIRIAHHNNTRGHTATLEMFDRAIAARTAELTRLD